MKLRNRRKIAQAIFFVISNLGFIPIFKTGLICPFLYCYACPFATFGCPIGSLQNFVLYQKFPIYVIGSLGVYGTILGRAFCGWACPFGTLHDVLSPTNRRREIKTRNRWHLKYAVLFLTIASAWFALDSVFCKLCPSGSLFAAIPFRLLHASSSEFGLFFHVHVITLALTVILAVMISRFWCRYLCPLGAVTGAFNKVGMLTIQRDDGKCGKCGSCVDECVMGIVKIEDIGTSTDCILCGRCVEECPDKALSFKIKG